MDSFYSGASENGRDIWFSRAELVLTERGHCYCVLLNAHDGAAFPSETSRESSSSSNSSPLEIDTGSGKSKKSPSVADEFLHSTRETMYPFSNFDDRHPSTMAMTVLVEMFNGLNNPSENQSLLVVPPWSNFWLVGSIVLTMLLHMLLLYVKPLSILFPVMPLSWADWIGVLYLSFPVIIIDEILKFFSRNSCGLIGASARSHQSDSHKI